MNVVLVLIESMSANRMGIYGNERNLTPNLDSLCRNSVFFDQCYSNGIHTNAGIYSSIYGMPIMMMQHPMLNGHSETAQFTGLPVTLKDLGYETIFFCTHPKTFDNLDIFLNRNGFDMISDQFDYPDTAIANSWGVGDETLLEHAHDRLNKIAQDSVDQPFFATILTITTHPPFTLPGFTKFKPTRTDPVEITYEYTDWAIKCFMDSVAQEPWYKNTVFVFVGDHGVNIPGPYEVPLSYNHVPLIIHAPALFPKPMLRHDLANQTDIFPTIMGLLRQDYVQNTLGYDLFREKRPFAIFSQDLKMGVIDDQHLYIARKSGKETLFDYEKAFGEDILAKNKVLTDSMRNYYCSQLLVAEYMILGNKTGPQKAQK
jgi:phosphoglycerol transferase MdoB-like AlkP superfamily enzyme